MLRNIRGRGLSVLRALELLGVTALLIGAAPVGDSAPENQEATVVHIGRTRLDPNTLMMTFRGQHFALTYDQWSAPVRVGEIAYEGSVRAVPYDPKAPRKRAELGGAGGTATRD